MGIPHVICANMWVPHYIYAAMGNPQYTYACMGFPKYIYAGIGEFSIILVQSRDSSFDLCRHSRLRKWKWISEDGQRDVGEMWLKTSCCFARHAHVMELLATTWLATLNWLIVGNRQLNWMQPREVWTSSTMSGCHQAACLALFLSVVWACTTTCIMLRQMFRIWSSCLLLSRAPNSNRRWLGMFRFCVFVLGGLQKQRSMNPHFLLH